MMMCLIYKLYVLYRRNVFDKCFSCIILILYNKKTLIENNIRIYKYIYLFFSYSFINHTNHITQHYFFLFFRFDILLDLLLIEKFLLSPKIDLGYPQSFDVSLGRLFVTYPVQSSFFDLG